MPTSMQLRERTSFGALLVFTALAISPDSARACPDGTKRTMGVTGRERVNLGGDANDEFHNCEARISADGQTLYYNHRHNLPASGGGGVYRSRWDGTQWGAPELLVAGGTSPAPTRDESRIYYVDERSALAVLERQGPRWVSKAVVFESNAPRVKNPAVSPDGNTLVFVGPEMTALWTSTRNPETDTWSAPVRMSRALNGSGVTWHPFIGYDGKRLLYNTSSPEIIGATLGIDDQEKIVESIWDEDTRSWGTPKVLGEFGCSPSVTEDGKHLYYGGRFEGGHGGLDVWTEKLGDVEKETHESRPSEGPPTDSRWCSLGRLPGATSVGALGVTPSGKIFAATSNGVVYRFDGHERWSEVHVLGTACVPFFNEDSPMVDLVALADGTVVAASPTEIAFSRDDGATWTTSSMPASMLGARALVASGTGIYAATSDGHILYSSDRGASFSLRGDIGHFVIALGIDSRGRLLAASGFIAGHRDGRTPLYRSDDGGQTWDEIAFPTGGVASHAFSILASADGTVYVGYWGHATASAVAKVGEGPMGDILMETSGSMPGDWSDPHGEAMIETADGIYVGVEANTSGELVFQTNDGANTWMSTGKLSPARAVLDLARLPDGTLIAGTAPFGEIYRMRKSTTDECAPSVVTPAIDGGFANDTGTAPSDEVGCACRSTRDVGSGAFAFVALAALGLRLRRPTKRACGGSDDRTSRSSLPRG